MVAEPVRFSDEQLRSGGWASDRQGELQANVDGGAEPAGGEPAAGWRRLAGRGGGPESAGSARAGARPGEWARLQEAYERQLGHEPGAGQDDRGVQQPGDAGGQRRRSDGDRAVVRARGRRAPRGWSAGEGLEQIYSTGESEESWAWVPVVAGVAARADVPAGGRVAAAGGSGAAAAVAGRQPARRRETPMNFEELGWLARRSRKGRGFVGRSWLGVPAAGGGRRRQGG